MSHECDHSLLNILKLKASKNSTFYALPFQFPIQVDLKEQKDVYCDEEAPPTHIGDHLNPEMMHHVDE